MLHMLEMHWLFVLKAAASERVIQLLGVGGRCFRGLSIVSAEKLVFNFL